MYIFLYMYLKNTRVINFLPILFIGFVLAEEEFKLVCCNQVIGACSSTDELPFFLINRNHLILHMLLNKVRKQKNCVYVLCEREILIFYLMLIKKKVITLTTLLWIYYKQVINIKVHI